jgi:hypothetical protein
MKRLFYFFLVCSATKLIAQNGPGGVGTTDGTSNLVLWLKANTLSQAAGSNVTSWLDQSGYANNASAVTTNEPTFNTGVYNGQPAIGFNSANRDYLRIADATSLKPNNISIFVVGKYLTGSIAYAPFVIKTDTYSWTNGYGITLTVGASASYTFVNQWNANFVKGTLADNTPVILQQNYNSTDVSFLQNNLLQGTDPYNVNIANSTNNLYLGISPDDLGTGVQAPLNGDIAEVIILNRGVNSAESIIINNYLSAKYNIAIGANDYYTNDYVANGNYDVDVAGIGSNGGIPNVHADAKGGLVRIYNATNLTGTNFLLWGHDNAPLLPTLSTDLPLGIISRAGRTWRANEFGDVGAHSIQFDLTGIDVANQSDLRLLVDVNNNDSFADETPIAGCINVAPNLYEFSNITQIANGTRFTLATINLTSLPIKLNSFEVRNIKNTQVQVNWGIDAVSNIASFELYHAKDGQQWHKVSTVAANSTIQNYSAINAVPYKGLSYYKIKINYNNGNVEYSTVKSVVLDNVLALTLSPNPATDILFLEGASIASENIFVYSLHGQDVTGAVTVTRQNNARIMCNIKALPKGLYIIKTSNAVGRFVKQ